MLRWVIVSWAALLYPLHVLHSDSDGLRIFGWGGENSAVEFAYVVNPREWSVLTCRSALASAQGKIILQETEQPRSLLGYSLVEKCTSLSLDSLQRLSDFLDLQGGRDRASLLRDVADAVFSDHPDRDNLVADISRRDASGNRHSSASATLLQDPLFEAAWDDLPRDEQLEYPEVHKEKTRGRVRRHVAAVRESERRARACKRRRTRWAQTDPARVDREEQPLAPAQGDIIGQGDRALAPAQGNVLEGADAGQGDPALAPARGNIAAGVDGVAQPRTCGPRPLPGVPRGLPWGRVINDRPMFVLARIHAHGVLKPSQ